MGTSSRNIIPGLGEAIRARRLAKSQSVRELAELAGSGLSAVQQIERSERAVSLDLARRIALALGCGVDDLLADAERLEVQSRAT